MDTNFLAPAARAAIVAAVCGLLAWPAPAAATCVGDCNSDGEVTVDEIITGVNIALGTASVANCLAFDNNADGQITVDEILTGVTNALTGCPTPVCGDGEVDFDIGETCDDGNTVDGDACPSNCRIEPCEVSGETVTFDIEFEAPSGVSLAALTTFLRYPDGVVRIPGYGNDANVQGRLVAAPDNIAATPNDLDYALRYVAFTPDLSPISEGGLYSVTFDRCEGAPAPSVTDFSCMVEDAADTEFNSVDGVFCSVRP